MKTTDNTVEQSQQTDAQKIKKQTYNLNKLHKRLRRNVGNGPLAPDNSRWARCRTMQRDFRIGSSASRASRWSAWPAPDKCTH